MGKMGTCTKPEKRFQGWSTKKPIKPKIVAFWFATDEIRRRYATEPPRPPVAVFRIYVSELDAPPRRGADTPPGGCAPSVHPSGGGVTNADALSTTELGGDLLHLLSLLSNSFAIFEGVVASRAEAGERVPRRLGCHPFVAGPSRATLARDVTPMLMPPRG